MLKYVIAVRKNYQYLTDSYDTKRRNYLNYMYNVCFIYFYIPV